MIRIIIADDHQVLIDGFEAILEKVANIKVVATASNGKQVIDLLNQHDIDVALLDINMPVLNGVETCKHLYKYFPTVKVIALSMHHKQSFVKRMMQNGACGYILKDDPATQIVEGIEAVMNGEIYYSPRVRDIMLSFTSNLKRDLIYSISDREIEVLQLISKGMTNLEMATQLHLSPHTTESHRRHLLSKLEAKNTADLVRIAMEKGLI